MRHDRALLPMLKQLGWTWALSESHGKVDYVT